MEKCPMYEKGNAAERLYRQKDLVFCKINPESCPYHKAQTIMDFAEEETGIICTSNGLIDKVEEDAKFKLRKNAKLPIILK